VAAGVLIDLERLGRRERRAVAWLNDSKAKSPEEREKLYPHVIRAATRFSVAVRSVRAIDGRGLHVSNLAALADCMRAVYEEGAACLVDGFRIPCEIEHTPVIDGDARSAAIAAASVIAKVTRDRYMRRAHAVYPAWNFAGNVGYSTPEHREAILANGISPLHRRSFASVAYSQLELGESTAASSASLPGAAGLDALLGDAEEPLGHLKGIAEVIEISDATIPEGDPDDVEAQVIELRRPPRGEPGSGEAAQA
jgi:ribonuclease HII